MNLLESLRYEPADGHFYWTQSGRGRRIGEPAGGMSGNGYWQIRIGGRLYYAHRLAWLASYGELPHCEIDHINGDPLDNRVANLRKASHAQNSMNVRPHRDSLSGLKGAYFDKADQKWYSCIRIGGQNKFLGYFATAEKAHGAYVAASREVHGQFSRHKE